MSPPPASFASKILVFTTLDMTYYGVLCDKSSVSGLSVVSDINKATVILVDKLSEDVVMAVNGDNLIARYQDGRESNKSYNYYDIAPRDFMLDDHIIFQNNQNLTLVSDEDTFELMIDTNSTCTNGFQPLVFIKESTKKNNDNRFLSGKVTFMKKPKPPTPPGPGKGSMAAWKIILILLAVALLLGMVLVGVLRMRSGKGMPSMPSMSSMPSMPSNLFSSSPTPLPDIPLGDM